MSNKKWVALTGLCVLLGASAAQAHLIPICVEAYESGRAPDLSESSAATDSCVPQADGSFDSTRQLRLVSEAIGPGAGVQLLPVAAAVPVTEASLDPVTEFAEFDSRQHRPSSWAWALDGAANRWLMSASNTFHRAFGAQGGAVSSSAGQLSRVATNTSDQGAGSQASRPNLSSGNSSAAGNSGGNGNGANIGNGQAGGGNVGNGNAATGNAGHGNNNSVPAGGNDGGSSIGGIGVGVGGVGIGTPAVSVPEPMTLALFMIGALGLAVMTHRRRAARRQGVNVRRVPGWARRPF